MIPIEHQADYRPPRMPGIWTLPTISSVEALFGAAVRRHDDFYRPVRVVFAKPEYL